MSKDQETTRKYGYALLAGGAGKRMGGSNKAALMHDGVTFLERISSEMDKTRSACYISIANHRQDIPDGLDRLFFAPCDAPLYTSDIHEKLAGHICRDDDAVCWKTADGRVQATFGWYSVSCLPALKEDAKSDKYKLIRTLERVSFKTVDTEEAGLDDRIFMNINSARDYRSLKGISSEHGVQRRL